MLTLGDEPPIKLMQEAADRITDLQTRLERYETALERVRAVVENGYPDIGKTAKCPHDRFGFEDCIACYDEALLKALGDSH